MNNCTLIGRLGKDAESKQHGKMYGKIQYRRQLLNEKREES